MPLNDPIPSGPNLSTKDGQLAAALAEINASRQRVGSTGMREYKLCRKIYTGGDPRFPLVKTADLLAALGPSDAAKLQGEACAAKAFLNFGKPGSVTDDVPAATITLPG